MYLKAWTKGKTIKFATSRHAKIFQHSSKDGWINPFPIPYLIKYPTVIILIIINIIIVIRMGLIPTRKVATFI